MKMLKWLWVPAVMAVLPSCMTSESLYSWHDYEKKTYQYSKKRTDELKMSVLEEFQKMIGEQNGLRRAAPPGMYAEYGYMLYRTGKKEEGIRMMKEEINWYPESEKYISRIIKQLEE